MCVCVCVCVCVYFLNLGVWNPKLGDRPQLRPVLPLNSFPPKTPPLKVNIIPPPPLPRSTYFNTLSMRSLIYLY